MDYFIDFHVISKKLRINICSHHLNIFASLWKCERYQMFIQNAFFHIIFTLIFIFQLSLISQSIFDIFLFNHDQFVMLHFDKLIQKNTNNTTTNKWSPVSIGRPLPRHCSQERKQRWTWWGNLISSWWFLVSMFGEEVLL